jgi:isopentenyl diphosphate isomerase/L-lactate dehydrogenase-like FMN-dependent dehydrogenase
MEIYLGGTQGRRLPWPMAIESLEQKAREVLRPEAYDYLAGGAGSESTMKANRQALDRWRIVPRFLRDCSSRDLHVEVAGQHLSVPFLLAPIGVQSILHPDAELAVARAARSAGVPLILSTLSSRPLEEIAKVMEDVPHWFQLYWPKSRELAASFCQRAERAGYSALVVTLDTYYLGWRERDLQRAYLPFVEGLGMANYFGDPAFRAVLPQAPEQDPGQAIRYFLQIVSNPALTWKDLAWLRATTRLPILLKGILDPNDALKAAEHGMDGVIVSNHGGRQLDGAIAALDALPGVVQAAGSRLSVLFDSGIRRAADVLKAAALGARAVLLGRPYCYGLAVGGEAGVRDVLLNLLADLDLSLALAGCNSLGELGPANLAKNVV